MWSYCRSCFRRNIRKPCAFCLSTGDIWLLYWIMTANKSAPTRSFLSSAPLPQPGTFVSAFRSSLPAMAPKAVNQFFVHLHIASRPVAVSISDSNSISVSVSFSVSVCWLACPPLATAFESTTHYACAALRLQPGPGHRLAAYICFAIRCLEY